MKKMVSLVLAGVLSMTMLAACGNGAASKTDNAATAAPAGGQTVKKYTFGTDATFPPFEYEKDGKYTGIDIELINAIAKDQGFEVDMKPMNFKGIIPAMVAKQLDGALAGISITDERKQTVNFSDSYFQAGVVMVVRQDNTSIKTPEDLKGKTIAIKKGTSGAKKADELAAKYGAKVNYFDDSPTMYQEVVNKNADVTIEDFPVVSYMLAQNPDSKLKIVGDRLNGDFYGIAVAKGNDELLKKVNDGLKKMKDNGQLDEIVKKYMGTTAK
jgi:glutamine transport system substrate-binding protein